MRLPGWRLPRLWRRAETPALPVGGPTIAGGFAERGGDLALFAPDTAEQTAPEALAEPDASLSDEALLVMLLGFVWPHDPTPAARAALARFGSFAAVLAASERDLRALPGLGTHSIAAIKLVHGAALRLCLARVMHRPVLENWAQLTAYLGAVLAREKIEQFRILFLDADRQLMADEAQARGTVNHTPVYPREVVRRALELQAKALILVHNHPTLPISITLGHATSH